MTDKLAALGALSAYLFFAHQFADHWVQTEHQARAKGLPGWPGRLACARHVATYTLTLAVGVTAVAAITGWRTSLLQLIAAMAVNAVTHYIADRRTPLRKIAELAGHAEFWALGAPRPGRDDNPSLGTGAYALDQSWHYLWIAVVAAILVV